eukprot:gene8025-17482_t
MLIGLCMISQSLQSFLETMFMHALIWGPDKCLKNLVAKNLCAHRTRSTKTYLMFTISLASIIFGGAIFTLLAESITQNLS